MFFFQKALFEDCKKYAKIFGQGDEEDQEVEDRGPHWGLLPLIMMMIPVLGLNIYELYKMDFNEFCYFTTYEIIRREKESKKLNEAAGRKVY